MVRMQYALNVYGSRIDAKILSLNLQSTIDYKCIYCGGIVNFVNGKYKYFRHDNGKSCIVRENNTNDGSACTRLENNKILIEYLYKVNDSNNSIKTLWVPDKRKDDREENEITFKGGWKNVYKLEIFYVREELCDLIKFYSDNECYEVVIVQGIDKNIGDNIYKCVTSDYALRILLPNDRKITDPASAFREFISWMTVVEKGHAIINNDISVDKSNGKCKPDSFEVKRVDYKNLNK